MDVSPQTLREVEFREKLRGYNQDDVDEFLERVAAGVEILQDRLRQATDRALRAEQRASETDEADEAVRKTLVLAQRTADLAVQEAKEQADHHLEAARSEAKRIEAEAHAQARGIAQEAQARLRADLAALEVARSRLRSDVAALERHVEEQRTRVRDAMRDALKRLEGQIPGVAPAPVAPKVEIPDLPVDDLAPAPSAPASAAPAPPSPVAEATDDAIFLDDVVDDDALAADREAKSGERAPSPYADFVDDDDAFLAELRSAAQDTSPLGPRADDGDTDDGGELDPSDEGAQSRWRRR